MVSTLKSKELGYGKELVSKEGVRGKLGVEGKVESKVEGRIIEGFSWGKKKGVNNDRIIDSRRYIAVVDGVSSKNKVGGKTLSDIIVDYFEYNLYGAYDFEEVISRTNRMTVKFKKENGLMDCNKDGFVCGVIDKYKGKVYIIGDITLRLNGFVHTKDTNIDELKSMYRSYLINRYIKLGYTEDDIENIEKEGRLYTELLGHGIDDNNSDKNARNNLITQDMFIGCDSDFGYMVVNGGEHRIEYDEYDIKKGDCVILASDGYPTVLDTFPETEKELQRLLKEDRMCYKTNKQVHGCYKDYNSYDDRTYIRVGIK